MPESIVKWYEVQDPFYIEMKLKPFVSSHQLICLFIPLLMHDMTSHLDCLDITAPSSQSKLLGIREPGPWPVS